MDYVAYTDVIIQFTQYSFGSIVLNISKSLSFVSVLIMSIIFLFFVSSVIQLQENISFHNKLYLCRTCDNYFRQYQLYNKIQVICPHCSEPRFVRSHPSEYSWMDHHKDFRKHSFTEYFKYKKLERKIYKDNESRESHYLWLKHWNK